MPHHFLLFLAAAACRMRNAVRRMAALPGGERCARLRRGSDAFFGLGSLLAESAWGRSWGRAERRAADAVAILSGGEAYDSRSESSSLFITVKDSLETSRPLRDGPFEYSVLCTVLLIHYAARDSLS